LVTRLLGETRTAVANTTANSIAENGATGRLYVNEINVPHKLIAAAITGEAIIICFSVPQN
jgi:hypothetical protein